MSKQKSSSRVEPQKLRSALLGGCFLLSMILLVVYTSYVVSFSNLSFWRSNRVTAPVPKGETKIASPHQADARYQKEKLPSNPFCDFSNRRNDYCEMEGDIRIHGNSSSIFFVASSNVNATKLQESWKLKPHPRKGDARAMARVTEMSVKTLSTRDAPKCAVHSSVPAIVFSTGGYMGNFFHDFTDILITIFTTSQQFNGEVQFLISEILPWWNEKYQKILKSLTNYEIIDFNQDQVVRCYPHVIMGLKFHKEMSIDPSKSPYGLTMVDFGRFIRKSFALERDTAIKLGPDQVVIQVVPLGGLEGISWIDFGLATVSMKMHYMQYTISLDESTLTEQFARGDPVLSDQKEAYKKHGWDRMIDLYFAKQGVKLDMGRFSSTLLHALELLRQQ
ncbi:hypothetical protein OPV22_003652 [Ensete ventricosum]|uniref:O-fucosyltransferase family protein n=1 Tax=Ensete ventricosum TaxID=4639 RepID=A0AAV8S1G3_ENSVE|nr:hypothetical protein OPV22_003652 [Ensete ventricosum]